MEKVVLRLMGVDIGFIILRLGILLGHIYAFGSTLGGFPPPLGFGGAEYTPEL